MTFQAEVIDALPPAPAKPDADLLRNFLIKRLAIGLAAAENPQDFVARDVDTGEIWYAIDWNETRFWLDPDDVTSVHDGVTVIVTADDYRYKVGSVLEYRIRSVKSRTTTAPPASPDFGDAYIVPAGPSGDWATFAQHSFAMYTGRGAHNGWEEVLPAIGHWVYVEDSDSFARLKTTGWASGPGAQSISAGTIALSAAINWGYRVRVVNQTTTAPPGSPALADAYVVGPSATGAWTGHDRKIAIWEGGPNWAIYAPPQGALVYDTSQDTDFRFSGTAWVSQAGAIVGSKSTGLTASGSTTSGGSGNYTWSDTVAPTTSQNYIEDGVALTYTARKAGARLRFSYEHALGSAGNICAYALFMDSVANALDWHQTPVAGSAGGRTPATLNFETTAVDAGQHTYKIRLVNTGNGMSAPSRRRLSVMEFA